MTTPNEIPVESEPRGFHLGACERSWKASAPADEGCVPNCPRRLWAENERLRTWLDRIARTDTLFGAHEWARQALSEAALSGSSGAAE